MDRRERNFSKWYDFDANRMIITFENDEGDKSSLPVKYKVCSTCDGKGSHVNPSIDSHGITAEEWANDWDDESREMYFRGDYDIPCNECNGNRVVPEIDEARADKETLALFLDIEDSLQEMYRTEAMERKYGA